MTTVAKFDALQQEEPTELGAGPRESGDGVEMGEIDLEQGEDIPVDERRTRAPTFSPAAPENAPTVLTFANITVKTKTTGHKELLHGISGNITGGFWAIMGSSGSGKTTLLSALSLRLDRRAMDVQGDIRLNGREYSTATLKSMSAYVMQDDLLHAELTVEETLHYAALLRMPLETTPEDRARREAHVLELMGITHCKNTIVGNTRKKGISGGERKRLCVAIELLNHPKLIFLDEPTSGLDSSTACSVIEALKKLSDSGECTVVCTIHQPQPKIFAMFDNLILMKQGNIVYQGNAMKVVKFLEVINKPCPPNTNLADHLLDVISPVAEDAEKLEKFIVPVDLSLGIEKDGFETTDTRLWINEFSVLVRRNFQQFVRRYDIFFMAVSATVVMACFIGGGIWHDIGTGQASIATRAPSLFFACVNQGIVSSMQVINSFPGERPIMLRERAAGAYCTSSYFLAKTVVDSIGSLLCPIIFTCIVYPMIGYQMTAKRFFLYMMFMVMDATAATSMATAVTCLCVSVEMSTVLLSCLFEMCRLYGGFFTSPEQLKEFPNWRFADALSYIKYAYVGVALNELHGLKIECDTGTTCSTTSGEQIAHQKGYDEYTIAFCAGILAVYIVVARIIAFICLRYIKN